MSTTAAPAAASRQGRGGAAASAWFWRYLAKRVAQGIAVILIVTLIVFALMHLALPDGPGSGVLGMQATDVQIAAFNHEHGFDLPVWQQYVNFLGQIATGDFGTSFEAKRPVLDLLAQRLPKTLLLAVLAMAVALLVSIPLGVAQAVRRNKPFDTVMTAINFVLYSTPSFFLGLILVIVFTQWMHLLPATAPQGQTVAAVLAKPQGLVLPVLTGAIPIIATFSRYMRSSTLENLGEDYVRTARSKGTPVNRVVVKHVFRNSLTPIIAMLGYYLPVMFGGMIVVESLFNYPGMGLLFWTSAQKSDYPVLMGCMLIIAIATVIGSLVADLIQAALDPRTRGALK
ncbi:MAG: ABC transporter permease [Arthrobacter sp.]|jgi:peptide/nickel transport system permease protein|nr:ABC transporter permease [Arthrobacter sp.]